MNYFVLLSLVCFGSISFTATEEASETLKKSFVPMQKKDPIESQESGVGDSLPLSDTSTDKSSQSKPLINSQSQEDYSQETVLYDSQEEELSKSPLPSLGVSKSLPLSPSQQKNPPLVKKNTLF